MSTETKAVVVVAGQKVPAVKPPLKKLEILKAAALALHEEQCKEHEAKNKVYRARLDGFNAKLKRTFFRQRNDKAMTVRASHECWMHGQRVALVELYRPLTDEERRELDEVEKLRPSNPASYETILEQLRCASAAPDRVAEVLKDDAMRAEFVNLAKALLSRPTVEDKAKAVEA